MKRIRPSPWEQSTGDREDFWELPCMFVASKGLEIPWLQGLLPEIPLGFASRGRGLIAGCCQEDQAWVEFHRDVWKYAENSSVCLCTLPGGLEGWGPYLGCMGRLPIAVDPADTPGTWEEKCPSPSTASLCWGGLLSSSEHGSGSQALSVDRPVPSTALSCMSK